MPTKTQIREDKNRVNQALWGYGYYQGTMNEDGTPTDPQRQYTIGVVLCCKDEGGMEYLKVNIRRFCPIGEQKNWTQKISQEEINRFEVLLNQLPLSLPVRVISTNW